MAMLIIGANKGFCEGQKSQKMDYIPKILFTLGYGTESNQIGIAPEDPTRGEGEGLGDGPLGEPLLDSEGNIYIGDCVNGKIKKFDQSGKLLFVTQDMGPEFYPQSFRIDNQSNIYVIGGLGGVVKFDNQGRFVRVINYDPFGYDEEKLKSLRASSPEIAEIPSFEDFPLIDGKGREYKVRYTTDYALDPDEISIVKEQEIRIETYSPNKKVMRSFILASIKATQTSQKLTGTPTLSFPDYKDLKFGLRVDFVDRKGNIYASGLARRNEPLVLKEGLYINSDIIVYKYDPQGNFITQVRFHNQPSVVPHHLGTGYIIDPSGNIYALQFHAEGMDVVKYKWKPIFKEEEEK